MVTPTIIRSRVFGQSGKVQMALQVISLTEYQGVMVDHTVLDPSGMTTTVDQARWSTETAAIADWEERCAAIEIARQC